MKRFLNLTASEMLSLDRKTLKESIKASEGRIILSENIVVDNPPAPDVTSSEIARSAGADLILLNLFDVNEPFIRNLGQGSDIIRDLREIVGRPVGVNLEPVSENANLMETMYKISDGRKASVDTLKKARELGFDFVCFTGNPATGVTNAEILNAIKIADQNFGGMIIAGKMHSSGVDEPVVDVEAIREFIDAGADVILIPAVGTVPGVTDEMVREAIRIAHEKSALTMASIGTSQESSSPELIREIALRSKINGFDIHHMGDGSAGSVSPYLNIIELSRTIRGDRHTMRMMASSIKR